jgi:hypothetical protein
MVSSFCGKLGTEVFGFPKAISPGSKGTVLRRSHRVKNSLAGGTLDLGFTKGAAFDFLLAVHGTQV